MVWVTGQSALCPLGRDPAAILEAVLAGKSAVTEWRDGSGNPPLYSKIGADLGDFDVTAALKAELPELPADMAARLRPMLLRLPRHVHFSLWLALEAWKSMASSRDGTEISGDRTAVIVAGHNLNSRYIHQETATYLDEPDFIDGLYSVSSLDSIHPAAVCELLNATGPSYITGSACASGLHALRAGLQEIAGGEADRVYVIGTVLEAAPVELDNMVSMQAVAGEGGNGEPANASRPFDQARYGFVPAQGGACIVLEKACPARGALGRVEAVSVTNDAQHLPVTNQSGQERTMRQALQKAGLGMGEIAFISAHATSTPQGDLTEIRAVRALCEEAGCPPVPVNAPKSMLGHCLWSSALIETTLMLEQLRAGRMHGNRNLERPDEDWIAGHCPRDPSPLQGRTAMKNAFGFGGYNASIILTGLSGPAIAEETG